MNTYDAIMSRRMVPRPKAEPAPAREQIQKLLDAAVRAPTHFLTQPWRFVVLTGDALKELGDAWARGDEREGRDPERARERPLRAPVILTVLEKPNTQNPKVVEVEEHHATGAAIQNILLAAHDMGLGAMIRTGAAAQLEEVRDYLGCAEGELIAGFIYLGYPPEGDDERPMTRRTPAAEKTEWRGFD
jgi:nitroreductase